MCISLKYFQHIDKSICTIILFQCCSYFILMMNSVQYQMFIKEILIFHERNWNNYKVKLLWQEIFFKFLPLQFSGLMCNCELSLTVTRCWDWEIQKGKLSLSLNIGPGTTFISVLKQMQHSRKTQELIFFFYKN